MEYIVRYVYLHTERKRDTSFLTCLRTTLKGPKRKNKQLRIKNRKRISTSRLWLNLFGISFHFHSPHSFSLQLWYNSEEEKLFYLVVEREKFSSDKKDRFITWWCQQVEQNDPRSDIFSSTKAFNSLSSFIAFNWNGKKRQRLCRILKKKAILDFSAAFLSFKWSRRMDFEVR